MPTSLAVSVVWQYHIIPVRLYVIQSLRNIAAIYFTGILGRTSKAMGSSMFWKTGLLWLWLLRTNQCCNPCRCHLTWFLQQSAMSCLLCRHNARVGEKVQWCGCRTHLNITSAARIVSNRSRPTKHPTDGIWPGSEASSIAKSLIGGRKTKGLHTC